MAVKYQEQFSFYNQLRLYYEFNTIGTSDRIDNYEEVEL